MPYFSVTQDRGDFLFSFPEQSCVRRELASGSVFWPPSAQRFFAAGSTGFQSELPSILRDGLGSRGEGNDDQSQLLRPAVVQKVPARQTAAAAYVVEMKDQGLQVRA